MRPRFCSACGAELVSQGNFCGRCGASIVAPAASAQPAIPTAPPGFVGPAETALMYGRRGIVLDGAFAPYAGFWIRFLASFIDGIIISIFTQPISLIVGQGVSVTTTKDAAGNVTDFSFEVDGTRLFIMFLFGTLVPAVYYIVAFSRWGQTLGCLAMSLKVVHPDGTLLSPGRAAVRWVGAFVSAMVFGLGYLWMIWDSKKQTWHDKMAGSVVVKVKRPGEV